MSAVSRDLRKELLARVKDEIELLDQGLLEQAGRDLDTTELWQTLRKLHGRLEGCSFPTVMHTLTQILQYGDPHSQAHHMRKREYRHEFIEAVTGLCAYFHIQDEPETTAILQRTNEHLSRLQQLHRGEGSQSQRESPREVERDSNMSQGVPQHLQSKTSSADDWGMIPQSGKSLHAAFVSQAASTSSSTHPSIMHPHDHLGQGSGMPMEKPPQAHGALPGEGVRWGLFEDRTEISSQSRKELPQSNSKVAGSGSPPNGDKSLSTLAAARGDALNGKDLVNHYLVCCLGTQHYALPIDCVREILAHRPERPLPSSRPGIIGLVTLRGQVFPVIDVSSTLFSNRSVSSEAAHPERRCMIVCEVEGRVFCFKVDEVKQVIPRSALPQAITPLNQEQQIHRGISHASTYDQHSLLFVNMQEVIPA
jgi:chemotaxis signal transduction protein